MIAPSHWSALSVVERAGVIYHGARAELDQRLWRAALGAAEEPAVTTSPTPRIDLDALVRTLVSEVAPASPSPEALAATAEMTVAEPASTTELDLAALGPNARHGLSIEAAAARTGVPAASLAAIIDAEAAKTRDGAWNPLSRNPRSSAAGLGQFLSGTWVGEAERSGSWLHAQAKQRGWLDPTGDVRPDCKAALLALRYDPVASIQTVADYARRNLDRLKRAGVEPGDSIAAIGKAAYLAHHLGPGDAVRFLRKGLPDAHAGRLLAAQVGPAAAASRIAAAGEAAEAHRIWLTTYVDRRIQPRKFLA